MSYVRAALWLLIMAVAAPAFSATLITDVYIVDGSGAPARRGSVRISGQQIEAVGDLRPAAEDELFSGNGLVLAPGFIDAHSHHNLGIENDRAAIAVVNQGVTTVVVGQDGFHDLPLREFFLDLEHNPATVNFASMAGHSSLRLEVMGDDFGRKGTAAEIEKMRQLLENELEAGALGLSSGLEYDPGSFADTAEIMALAREVARFDGVYQSHIRSEDQYFWEAIDEAILIGRDAGVPVIVTHLKLGMKKYWGQSDRLLKVLDDARNSGVDVSADIYPYDAWNSDFLWLATLFPERDLDRRDGADYILQEMLSPEGVIIFGHADLPVDGMTIAEVARQRRSDPATVLMDLLKSEAAKGAKPGINMGASMLGIAMDEADIEAIMSWSHTIICTDGDLAGPHPRGYGAFTRVLGHYVREREVMSLETAVHKMSGMTADRLGIHKRGMIMPGYFADLVLFDPQTVADRATVEKPHEISEGIVSVWVNGEIVFANGAVTAARPGVPVTRRDR